MHLMDSLPDALERGKEMIREALEGARSEMASLKKRQAELDVQIREAERALGETGVVEPTAAMTLHDALAQVLRGSDNEGMTARELTDAVNARGLYRKRDGSSVEVNQVQARINNYDAVFEKVGATIQLREESDMLANITQSFTLFQDNDDGLFDWVEAHPDGYIINTERNPKPSFLVLHHGECRHLKDAPGVERTRNFVKVCSDDRSELEEWALDTVGGEVTLCRTCFG
jgi:hypothetical protein